MPASTQHQEYTKHFPRWELADDCAEGSAAVKSKKTKYLPKPNPDDTSAENSSRYDDYIARANFVGFTSSTLDGMLGMVFRQSMEAELHQAIAYLEENANGGGLTLEQMAKGMTAELLKAGRYGLLVDYPQAPEGLTAADVSALNLRANILPYPAKAVINWKTRVVGAVKQLSMVVLQEEHEEMIDAFESDIKTYHRVLMINDEGIYIQRLYDDAENQVGEDVYPKKSDGSYWTEIPFIFAGAQNNDECVDKAPLYDIAEINISHYRNSADFEESSFMVGQPTPVIAGLKQQWVDEVMKGGVTLGSRRAILLPEGGSANLLQANPNQLPDHGMEIKEQQMIKVGARIIQDASGNETAEAAKIRFGGQNSKLGTIVGNIEDALLQCFEWAMQFMNGQGDNSLTINRDFYDKSVDPQLVIAKIQLLDRGVIAMKDMRDDLRSYNIIKSERTDEEIESEAETGIMGF